MMILMKEIKLRSNRIVRDLFELKDVKVDTDELIISGHSFGGITALMAAAKIDDEF